MPQSRPRFSKGRVFEPARMTEYKRKVQLAARVAMEGKQPLSAALSCRLRFFRKFKTTSRRFGDCDNLAKAVLDACNGIVFLDDAQIVSLTTEKIQSEKPRVEMEVAQI